MSPALQGGFFFEKFLLKQLIYNVVSVSGIQQNDSFIHIIIPFQIFFPFRLLKNIELEQHLLCYSVGLYGLSILNILLCVC